MSRVRDRIAATAQPQTSSSFFDKLPFEIRDKIYDELWMLHDTRWHIHSRKDYAVPVVPCITSPDEEDRRYSNFQASRGDDAVVWESRLRSPWNTHWKCAEAAAARPFKLTSAVRARPDFAAPLLVCKRMYLESVESLLDALTFCFTDIIVAANFLSKHSRRSMDIRNIDISLRMKPLITELYFPGPHGEPQPHIGGITLTATNNPWEHLCRRLAALPKLRELHIYLDSEDLRPWHKRVNERSFLGQLFYAKAREYVIRLPDIPDDPHLRGLTGSFVEGDVLEKAPFVVKRGSRPNNWQLHLSRISHALPENWTHTLWDQTRERIWSE